MRAATIRSFAPDPLWTALGLTAAAFAAWGAVIWRALPAATAYGSLCGHDGPVHCALCLPAAALTVAAIAALAVAWRDARA